MSVAEYEKDLMRLAKTKSKVYIFIYLCVYNFLSSFYFYLLLFIIVILPIMALYITHAKKITIKIVSTFLCCFCLFYDATSCGRLLMILPKFFFCCSLSIIQFHSLFTQEQLRNFSCRTKNFW